MKANIGTAPYLCSFLYFSELGEQVAYGHFKKEGYVGNKNPQHKTFDDFVNDVIRKIEYLNSRPETKFKPAHLAVCQAVTTTMQPIVSGYFKELGFTPFEAPKYEKYDHGVIVWLMSAPDLINRLRELRGVDLTVPFPEDDEDED